MSALEAMQADLTARLVSRLSGHGVPYAAVARAVADCLERTGYAALLDLAVSADAAAQAFQQAYAGTPPAGLAGYGAAWTGARSGQNAINGGEMVSV